MFTNEKVLEIFQDYLNEDQATEVVMTRHGYAVMLWDHAGQDWSDVECCPTRKNYLISCWIPMPCIRSF